jgi:LPXTG-motif cell wall-anchored protein
MARSRLAVLLAALALLAPASAFAQSAGDEQYADPFGKVQKKKSGSGTQGSQGTQGTTGQGSSQPSTQSAPTTSQTTAAPAQQTLPRTGAPVGLLAASGAGLLCGGALLRRRVALS